MLVDGCASGCVPSTRYDGRRPNDIRKPKTETDLNITGTVVPAGTYSLFTIPEPDKWTLIISRKSTGGEMQYPGESEDLARIPMKTEHVSQTVDPFTISLESAAPAQLCLAWPKFVIKRPKRKLSALKSVSPMTRSALHFESGWVPVVPAAALGADEESSPACHPVG